MSRPRATAALLATVLAVSAAHAGGRPGAPPSDTPVASDLARANTAAANGDWAAVSSITDPLLARSLTPADIAEAHRLAGIAAFFQDHRDAAEAHFVEYLRFDLDGQLDPSLYQPEVVLFFTDVKTRHMGELRARRPKARRYWLLNLIPPGGQIQNGDHGKAILFGSLLGVFAAANLTSYFVLRSWCTETTGVDGHSAVCERDRGSNHAHTASTLRVVNLTTGIGLILTYALGVYDGVHGYRQRSPRPYISPVESGGVVGISGAF